MKIVVYGSGGHGKVVADILVCAGHEVVGFIDDGVPPGGDAWLAAADPADVQVALGIGDNAARAAVMDRCRRAGFTLATAVHPSAVVARSAKVGEGTVVMACAVINPDAQVGAGVIVNTGAVVEHDCVVGDHAHLSPNAALGGGAQIGRGAHVGLGAVVLPKARVGDRSIVGAGAAVVRDLPDDVVAVGAPARIRRELPR